MLLRTVSKVFALISIFVHYFYKNDSHFDDAKYIMRSGLAKSFNNFPGIFFFKTLFVQFSIHFSLAALPSSQQLSRTAVDFPVRSEVKENNFKCKGLYNDISRAWNT